MAFVQPAPVDITRDSYSAATRNSYAYSSSPCEPVVWVINPETNWVVRNSYGACVWVSKDTPIFDIDEKDQGTIDAVIRACSAKPSLFFRLYETAEGLRLILLGPSTWHGFAIKQLPNAWTEESELWKRFEGIPIDPKYKALCHKQQCFRARLTTKPWRSDGESFLARDPEDRHGYWPDPVRNDLSITRLIAAKDMGWSVGRLTALGLHDRTTGALEKTTTLA